MSNRFAKHVAVVTGGANGIGRAIALRLGAEGASVLIADREAESGAAVAEAIGKSGGRATCERIDVTDDDCGRILAEASLKAYGSPTLVALCAGITGMKNWIELEAAEWDRMMSVNLKGSFLCLQSLARQMIGHARGGSIVMLAATSGHGPRPDAAHYGASKAGLIHLTRSAALGLGPHRIRVNAISPGVVKTGMWEQVANSRASLQGISAGDYERDVIAKVPLGRAAAPEEVASLAAFLLSDEASYITGQVIMQDGGYGLVVA